MKQSARSIRSHEGGFALATTIILTLMLTALTLVGLTLARHENRSALRTTSRTAAFYAAETGLARAMEDWAASGAAATQPGDTVELAVDTLSGGSWYSVEITRLDDGSSIHPIFALWAEGRSRDDRAQRSGVLVASVPTGMPINAAMRVRGALKITGTADVIGTDAVPPALEDECPAGGVDEPGIVTTDSSQLDIGGDANVQGDPDILEDPDTVGFFNFGEVTYEELAATASITLADGTHISSSQPAPSLTESGACDTSDPYNWGDPENDGQPCSAYFPVIHATGDLKLSGSGAGQGILLVDGDLQVSGGVEFYGPVVVKGKVKSTGSFHFHGGVVAGATDLNDESLLSGTTQITYGSCVLRRALSRSAAAAARPLEGRAWFSAR